MLWNPQNIYTRAGLKREGSSEFAYQRPEKPTKDVTPLKRTREGEATGDSNQQQTSTVDPSPMASESMTDQEIANIEKQVPSESVTYPSVGTVGEHDPVDGSSILIESDQ
jgi:hypothetical protein